MRITALALALLLAGCSRKEDAAPATPVATPSQSPEAGPQDTPPDVPREAPLGPQPEPGGAAPQPAPERAAGAVELSVSVNGSINAEVPRGRPIVVTVDAPGAVELAVLDAGGSKVAWPMKKTGAGVWVLSDTSSAATGAYVVRASASGASSEARVRVVEPPATPTAEQQAEALWTGVQASLASGDRDGALKAVEERLKKAPKDVMALALKGDVLAAMGRKGEAAKAYAKAIAEWQRTHAEPPDLLLRKLAAVQPSFDAK